MYMFTSIFDSEANVYPLPTKKRAAVKGNGRPPRAFSLSGFLHHKNLSESSRNS